MEPLSGLISDAGSSDDNPDDGTETVRLPSSDGEEPPTGDSQEPGESVNLVDLFTPGEQAKMAGRVIEDYDDDIGARDEHMRQIRRWYELYASCLRHKDWPFQGAANVNIPLLAYAIIQVHGRLFDNLLPAKGNIYNSLPTRASDQNEVDRAERTELYANWYLRYQIPEYRMSYDATLWQMLIFGSTFRYQWWDPIENRICTDWVSVEDMVVPFSEKCTDPSMRGVSRYTLVRRMTLYEIQERAEEGEYSQVNTKRIKPGSVGEKKKSEFKEAVEEQQGVRESPVRSFLEDEDRHVLEQHRKLRLPNDPNRHPSFDGRVHPVIVVIDEATRTLLKVVLREEDDPADAKRYAKEKQAQQQQLAQLTASRPPPVPGEMQPELPPMKPIRPIRQREVCFFTHYQCFPSEGFYGLGLGNFVGPLNEAQNTIINQQIDRATVNNAGGGYVSRQLRFQRGPITRQPGKYVEVDAPANAMKDALQSWPQIPPDPESRWHIEYIEGMANRVSGSGDTLSGEPVGSNETARAAMNRYEQATKQITIIAGRVIDYMTADARIMWRLFSVYLDENQYYDVVDSMGKPRQVQIGPSDFIADARVLPACDPRVASRAQRIDEAQGFLQAVVDPNGPAELNQNPAIRYSAVVNFLVASDRHEMVELLGPPPGPPQPPPPKAQWEENAGFLRGEDQPVNPQDNDAEHLIEMDLFRRDALGYAKLDPTAAKMFDNHERGHLASKLEKARQAENARRQAANGPIGPQGNGSAGMAPEQGQQPPPGLPS